LLTQLTHALEREQAMQEKIQEQAVRLQQLKAQIHRRHADAGENSSSSAPAESERVILVLLIMKCGQ
jgi:hypothetical protein